MGILSKIFGSGSEAAGGLIDSLGKQIDRFVTTDEDKLKLKQKMEAEVRKHERMLEQELSKRHKVDMNSDSWWSKNVRPLTLVFLMITFFLLAFTDGNLGSLQVEDAYIQLLGQMLLTVFSFYFGGRTGEKIVRAIQDRKERTENAKQGQEKQDYKGKEQ